MWIHIIYDNFKWFNSCKIHVILRLFYALSNIQVKNYTKSLTYTGESQWMHRNTWIIVLCELRSSDQCHWRLKSSVVWQYVVGWAVPDVLNRHSPFIFYVNQSSGLIDPEDEGTTFLQNVRNYSPTDNGITFHKTWMFNNYAAGMFIVLDMWCCSARYTETYIWAVKLPVVHLRISYLSIIIYI